MTRPTAFLILCVGFLACLFAGCGGDSTSPENDGPATFSRVMGSKSDTDVMGLAVLSDGTRMLCGQFDGGLVVSGYPDTILAGGSPRNFLARFRPDGSVISTSQIGGSAVRMSRMVRDRDDNLLLVGSFSGNTNFANESFTAVGIDMIFARLRSDGLAEWVQVGSESGNDYGTDIAAANDGTIFTIYVTGITDGEMKVAGEDVGQNGATTGFVVGLGSDGIGFWQGTAGVNAGKYSSCQAVAVSADGSVVVCGLYTSPTLDFAGDVLNHGAGEIDSFIGRFDRNGAPLGSIHIQSAGTVRAIDVTTLDNDAIVTGYFDGSTDFDPSGAGGSVTSNGPTLFVARYSKAGQLRWVKTYGETQIGYAIAPLAGGNILVCGTFQGTTTLGSKTLTSEGNVDAFVARLDGDGKVLSAGQIGGNGEEIGLVVTTIGSTAIIAGSTTSDVITFPDGSHRNRIGSPIGYNGYIFQQP